MLFTKRAIAQNFINSVRDHSGDDEELITELVNLLEEAENTGYDDGWSGGYDEGHADGYDEGYDDSEVED